MRTDAAAAWEREPAPTIDDVIFVLMDARLRFSDEVEALAVLDCDVNTARCFAGLLRQFVDDVDNAIMLAKEVAA